IRTPDVSLCRTTCLSSQEISPNPYSLSEEGSRAGLKVDPTGGSCAVSPTRMSLHSVPEKTYSMRSSRSLPLPNNDESPELLDTIDASSTMKKVYLWRFLSSEKLPSPSLKDFCPVSYTHLTLPTNR